MIHANVCLKNDVQSLKDLVHKELLKCNYMLLEDFCKLKSTVVK